DSLFERRVAAPAVHLRPASNPGLHLVSKHVLWNSTLELIDEKRALRPWPDNRHFAFQDVPELRKLVQIEATEEAAERSAPRVIVARPHRSRGVLSVDEHRAELVHGEGAPVEAHPLLTIEDRARRAHPHSRGDGKARNRDKDQRRRA